MTPLVSVIIPTYNCRPLLAEALDALREQTLPAHKVEVIVVDDGSTDDTWPYLQELAAGWPQLDPIHQPNSGRPSVGRNVGLRRARGRYMFFHDADDLMSPDALRRLTAAADRLRSDVVVGQTRIYGGRRDRTIIRPADSADLMKDKVWTTLSAQKLFRRRTIARLRLEFCEDMVQGEDQVFVATALLAARRVTTLTDDDYYLRRHRTDGTNLSSRPQTLQNKMLTIRRLTDLIVQHVEEDRQPRFFDRVMVRGVAPALAKPFLQSTAAERAEALTELQQVVLPHLAARHLERASEAARMRLQVAAQGTCDDLLALNDWLGRRRQGEPPAAVRALFSSDDPARSGL